MEIYIYYKQQTANLFVQHMGVLVALRKEDHVFYKLPSLFLP